MMWTQMRLRMVRRNLERCARSDVFATLADNVLPKPVETVDENGVRTVVEYYINDQGKKVKVRIKTSGLLIAPRRHLYVSNQHYFALSGHTKDQEGAAETCCESRCGRAQAMGQVWC